MRRAAFTIIFAFLFNSAYSCSCWGYSFCNTTFTIPNDLIVSGQIVEVNDTSSIKLKIIEIFKGTESRDTITIWAGTGFDCNGYISMATHELGNLGDTIIIILPRIDSIQNSWDVIGDYRRPDHLCTESVLKLKNDTVRGIIYGTIGWGPPLPMVYSLPISNFRELWSDGGINCTPLSVLSHNSSLKAMLSLQGKNLTVNSGTYMETDLQVFDMTGREINKRKVSGTEEILLPFGNTQLLIVRLSHHGETLQVMKVVN